jgi:4-hydroxy-tetrahydrodipicolinate synthase
MAEHCFWLLSNGCHGLMVLDKEGEVAALAIAERIAILEGLASLGVPTSKILAGIGPASVADASRIAIRANDLGIRGVVASVQVGARVLPHDVISQDLRAVLAGLPERLHVYLSFAAGQGAVSTCLTAITALLSGTLGRLRGIRDELPGCGLGLAALERFGPTFEVYVADPAILRTMIQRGAAGLIGPGANLLGLHCRALLGDAKPEHISSIQKAIQSVGQVLAARRSVPAIKALLARQSVNGTWERVRLPLRPIGATERTALFQAFDACGVRLRPAERAVT